MDFFAGDLHNNDEYILTYEHRPFENVGKMRQTIITNFNNTVSNDDNLWILGDIGDIEILSELQGKIVIVAGNHDNAAEIRIKYPNIIVYDYPIMVDNLWLSHDPIGYMPPECPYLNVHAHLHRFNYGLLDRSWKGGNRYFCCSLEQINYTPISRLQIKEVIGYKG